ncbi:MAG: radical SAM/SPASM domain-containing protein [Phycisphaerae bacterium]
MKTIAVVEADFARGALGTRARLNDELLGETVLRRTLKRVLAAKRVDRTHLVVHHREKPQAEAAAADLDVVLQTHDAGSVPWREMVASGRKWSLDAWRGGLVGTTVFDESLNPWLMDAICRMDEADAVVAVPPAAPLLDPDLLDRLIEHYDRVRTEMRLALTQTAPGLSAIVCQPALLAELAKAGQPLCRIMAYRPDEPRKDLATQSACYAVPAEISHAIGRCITDTQAAMDRVARILCETAGDNQTPNAAAASRWLLEHRHDQIGVLPEEVEIELTTEDSLPHTTLRPRGSAVGRRGPMHMDLYRRLIDELATRDDARIVLGGFGDPLLHPEWPAMAAYARQAGILGIAVRTTGIKLDSSAIDALMTSRVDVINVLIDAISPATYRDVHRADCYQEVVANIEALCIANHQRRQPQPLIVCEMAKTRTTIGEMEKFFDHWIAKTGSVYVAGPSHYARQWPELAVMSMAPPARVPCHRIFHRALVLADGRVTVCDQDYKGNHTIGSLTNSTLSSSWTGPTMNAVRRSHLDHRFDGIPLCPLCEEWNRP